MLKKVAIIGAVLITVLVAVVAYMDYRNRSLSPRGEATLTNGDLTVSVTYGRPSVRGRVIFGSKEAGALQPFGAYWRLGANEATEITFNKDVQFNGNPLKAGSYRVYAIPTENGFEIVVNTELGKWGAFEPDHTLDILKTTVPSTKSNHVEQYTISVLPMENGVSIDFQWSDRRWSIPVTQTP